MGDQSRLDERPTVFLVFICFWNEEIDLMFRLTISLWAVVLSSTLRSTSFQKLPEYLPSWEGSVAVRSRLLPRNYQKLLLMGLRSPLPKINYYTFLKFVKELAYPNALIFGKAT